MSRKATSDVAVISVHQFIGVTASRFPLITRTLRLLYFLTCCLSVRNSTIPGNSDRLTLGCFRTVLLNNSFRCSGRHVVLSSGRRKWKTEINSRSGSMHVYEALCNTSLIY